MGKTILFLIDAWSSVAGGIQTVNRELCLALASHCKEVEGDQIEIVCICRDCSPAEQEDAKRDGVTLLRANILENDPGGDPRIMKMLLHSSLINIKTSEVICVVGHAKFTGLAARNVRDGYFPRAKVVTTYQMDVDETEVFKEDFELVAGPEWSRLIREWQERVEIERKIASQADIVFAIGPRLERSIKDALAGAPTPTVKLLLCGIRENVKVREGSPKTPTFVFIGRVEHPKVKGVDLFARAAGELVKRWNLYWKEQLRCPEPKFIIRGFPSDRGKAMFDELKAQAEGIAGRSVDIVPRPFSTEESSLVADVLSASAVVMPSRAEGFGLVALEAVSYRVPIVVAKKSGVAEMLGRYFSQPYHEPRYMVDTRGSGNEPVERLANALAYFVTTPEYGKLLGKDLRDNLARICSWSAAAKSFMEALIGVALPQVVHLVREESGIVPRERRDGLIDTETLRNLLSQEESPKLEFKLSYGQPQNMDKDEVAKDILALANTAGRSIDDWAYLIIGAGNELKPGVARDREDVRQYQHSKSAFLDVTNDRCTPPLPNLHYKEIELDGNWYGVISIPPSPHIHHLVKDLSTKRTTKQERTWRRHSVLIRRGDGVGVASPDEIKVMEQQKIQWSQQPRGAPSAGMEGVSPYRAVHPGLDERAGVLGLLRREADYVDDVCHRTSERPLEEIFVNREFEEWQPLVMEESGELEALEVEPPKPRQKGKGKKWSDVIEGLGAAIILGDPGSGKTVCLLREVQQRCLASVTSLESGSLSLEEITFAAYFHASQLGGRLVGTGGSVIDSAVDLLCERHGPISDGCRAWLRDKFKKGQVLLVVDALDEVPRGAGKE